MQALAINLGSSSLKAAIVDAAAGAPLWRATWPLEESAGGSAQLAARIVTDLRAKGLVPTAVVHRIVHGGSAFRSAVAITADVRRDLAALDSLAPLHNPPALALLDALRVAFPDVPHVAAFDTSFHARMPQPARRYALPDDLGIERFGFHGLSHSNVMHAVSRHLAVPPTELRIISCHLGNGASAAAIERGVSIDTSMGMTPLEGLVMGSRAGDLDPGAVLALLRSAGGDVEAVDALLSRGAGLMGMTGTHDVRELEMRSAKGDAVASSALQLYAYRVRKYIGAYAAVLGGVDVIAFTGGVGENAASMRARCLERLDFLGVAVDSRLNAAARVSTAAPVADINAPSGKVRLLVVAADEESEMVREAAGLLGA
jgi:acetate kinase